VPCHVPRQHELDSAVAQSTATVIEQRIKKRSVQMASILSSIAPCGVSVQDNPVPGRVKAARYSVIFPVTA
jgi:hypothetical protein